jgi:hypothetical protein
MKKDNAWLKELGNDEAKFVEILCRSAPPLLLFVSGDKSREVHQLKIKLCIRNNVAFSRYLEMWRRVTVFSGTTWVK